MVALTRIRVPNHGSPIERTGDDFVAVGIIERHRIDDIGVTIERKELFSRFGVPYFAGAIITSRNESVARFVEGTIGQGKQMGFERFEKPKSLLLVFLLFID